MSGYPEEAYNDDELLRRYRKGRDSQWLGILLERYTMLLLGVAMKYLKDRDTAADAVQQVFLKAILNLPSGDIGNFKGWLYVLMKNHCLQVLRDRKHILPGELLQHVPGEDADRDELYRLNEDLEKMHEALAKLQPEQRTCLELFYLRKQSYRQVMERTGFSFAQVKSFIQNGKRNMKILLLQKADTREK